MPSHHAFALRSFLATAVLGLAATGPAFAQPQLAGLSLQGGAGATHYSVDCTGLNRCDTSDTGYKFAIGLAFTPQFGMETVVIGFGKATFTDRVGSQTVTGDLQSTGVGLALRGSFDLTPSVYAVGRVGFLSLDNQGTARVGGFSASETQRKSAPYVGLGLGYRVSTNLSVGVDIDLSQAKFDGETGDVRLLGAFVRYAF